MSLLRVSSLSVLVLLALLCVSAASSSSLSSVSDVASAASAYAAKFLASKSPLISTGQIRFTPEQVVAWLQHGSDGKDYSLPPIDFTSPRGELFRAVRSRVITRAEKEARTILGGGDSERYVHPPFASVKSTDYPYWAFIPIFEGGVTTTAELSWAGTNTSCFGSNSARLTAVDTSGTEFNLTITSSNPSVAGCSDFYLLASIDSLALQTVSAEGQVSLSWTLPSTASQALRWDLHTKGVRVFRFQGNFFDMLISVIDTALLFEGETELAPSAEAEARNLDFLAKYAGVVMKPRNVTEIILDESLIQSGDSFGIMRLDGMDPMNGVQRTPYRTWLAQVKAAGQNAVHAPLAKDAADKFNATAALEWLESVEGLDYGYHNLLFGWIDTPTDNYPCLPPNWEVCLGWPVMEIVFGLMDAYLPALGDLLFNEAFNKRLGTVGLGAPELFFETVSKGYSPDALPTIVEQDAWMYNTTRNGVVTEGRSLVCCVFVCGIWKSAGLFDSLPGGADSVNCGELTNWDDFALEILDSPPRPAACVAADPDNPLCQIEGTHTIMLNNYASKAPYAHMAEHCPTKPPNFDKPPNC